MSHKKHSTEEIRGLVDSVKAENLLKGRPKGHFTEVARRLGLSAQRVRALYYKEELPPKLKRRRVNKSDRKYMTPISLGHLSKKFVMY